MKHFMHKAAAAVFCSSMLFIACEDMDSYDDKIGPSRVTDVAVRSLDSGTEV